MKIVEFITKFSGEDSGRIIMILEKKGISR